MRSFCNLLCSEFPHHTGRLYSHRTFKLVHAPQAGCASSHFFRRRRQVKQPERDRLCTLLFDFSPGVGDALRGMAGREEALELFALLFTAAEAELLLVDGIVKLMDTNDREE